MSLVGPRPERPELQKEIEKEVPEFGLRLQATDAAWCEAQGISPSCLLRVFIAGKIKKQKQRN
jgi:hypothetical protein